jgi:excisionase family DNA binding protein
MRKADAARYLGISIRTLTEWMQRHIVPYIKISHRVCLFSRNDLDAAMGRFRLKAVGE